ncbi:MAG: hypothetical protein NTW16_17425 [Bacteroidetes bacterium]|nr:hypothetical protein [Bacteroidota bacterium]
MQYKKTTHLLVISLLLDMALVCAYGQVSIAPYISLPDNSAMLDVKSSTKGVLVPRMTMDERNLISNPATGLLIYCTSDNQYYFYKGPPGTSKWMALNSQWVAVDTNVVLPAGWLGIGTTTPWEKVAVANGNILIDGGVEEHALMVKRIMSTFGPSDSSKNPKFSLGRIVEAGDHDPEFRVLYYDDLMASEIPVLEFDRKGIVASVKPKLPIPKRRGSHFEGFYDSAANPYFRLNSFPKMRLEMGEGGDEDVDVAMERLSRNKIGFYTNGVCRVVIDSAGQMGIGTLKPRQKLEVKGYIYSSDSGFMFPDGSKQKRAAPVGKSPWSSDGADIYFTSGNVGIGTDKPKSSVEISKGDLFLSENNSGLILTSPDGTAWKITVTNDGDLKATKK